MRVLLALARAQLPLWLVTPLLGLTLVFGLGGGYAATRLFTPPTNCPESPEICAEFGKFWQVWSLAKDHFVDADAIKPDVMTAGAINGMLDSLGDQGHTRYLTAEETARWNESLSGSFEGIGAYIDVRDNQPIIVSPIEGSPAEAAGIKPGDAILKIDDQDATGLSTQEIVTRVRGPEGTTVKLTLRHDGETTPFEVSITRAKVEVPSVSWKMLPDNVALVRLTQFAQNSGDDLEKALEDAKSQGARTIVFDMRNNPGGLVNEALKVAGQFLPADTPVLLEEGRDGKRTPLITKGNGAALDLPMVVLVNENTASSAEIVAGAIQDAKRAKVIGVPTIGTGTVLTPYNIDGGGQVLLGTVQWLTPDGKLIRKEGITPDVRVELPVGVASLSPSEAAALSAQALEESKDTQLVRALQELHGAAGN